MSFELDIGTSDTLTDIAMCINHYRLFVSGTLRMRPNARAARQGNENRPRPRCSGERRQAQAMRSGVL